MKSAALRRPLNIQRKNSEGAHSSRTIAAIRTGGARAPTRRPCGRGFAPLSKTGPALTNLRVVIVAIHVAGSQPALPTFARQRPLSYAWTRIYLHRDACVSRACGLLALDRCRLPSTRPPHCPPGAPTDDGFDRAGPRIRRSPCAQGRGAAGSADDADPM